MSFAEMSFTEKSAWIILIASLLIYAAYLAALLNRTAGVESLSEVPYVWPLASAWIGLVIAAIAMHIVAAIMNPKEAGMFDERDRDIQRRGELIGLYLVVVASIAAMFMAMTEMAHFWIANTLYLGLVLSTAISAILQIIAYRRGLPQW